MGTIHIEEREGAVFLITIDRPERRNALNEPLIDACVERLAQLASRAPRAAVVIGAGDAFCAGYDIQEIDPDQNPQLPLPDARFERVIRAFTALPCPVVAAVNGDAFGGGLDLALACDLCLASEGAKLAMTPCRLGLVYSIEGVARIMGRLGSQLARKLFLTGFPIDAAEAARVGALEIVAPDEVLLPRAIDVAMRIAANAPLAVSGTRRTIQAVERAITALVSDDLGLLDAIRTRALQSADLKEGLAAFAEKRAPKFRGE